MPHMRRSWFTACVVLCSACNVTPLPGGVTDDQTATTAVDAGGDTLGTTSGLPSTSTIASLGTTDVATLCDWFNASQGGYGRPQMPCPGGTPEATYPSQLACVNGLSALGNRCLDLTVGTVEDCVNQTGTNLCLQAQVAACMTIATCGLN